MKQTKSKEPTRKDIEDAIRVVTIRTEDLADTTGTLFNCKDVRALAWAAQKYLALPPTIDEVVGAEPPVPSKSVERRRAAMRKAKAEEDKP